MSRNTSDSKITTHICLPVLSITSLILLAFSTKKKETVIYYDILPRSLRGVARHLLKIPQKNIISALATITRLDIRKIDHGDNVPDYPHLHLKAMEIVTDIAEQVISETRLSRGIPCLEHLIGKKPSIAYFAKYISQHQLFPHILPLIVCYESLRSPDNYCVVWDPAWPTDWRRFIRRNLEWIKFDFFEWPRWYLFFCKFIANLTLAIRLPVIAVHFLLRRGITIKAIRKQRFKLIAEFIDPTRLNGTAYDADYWVDDNHVKKRDVLFFLSNKQKKFIKRNGHSIKSIRKLFSDKGYNLAVLDDLSYSFPDIVALLHQYVKLVLSAWGIDLIYCKATLSAWSEYLDYLPLFHHFLAENLIYLTFPNGSSSVRFDDAVVTGLCRKYGIKSCGCQTRTIYTSKFEDCFDCFDVYPSWGRAWHRTSRARLLFIEKPMIVGCIYLDYLIPLLNTLPDAMAGSKKKDSLTVSIFPTNITSYNHHFTTKFTISFLSNCARLAKRYPDYKFIVKPKDPEDVEKILAEEEFTKVYATIKDKDNFVFLDQSRHDYANVLASSDIIIAIGFTTPGIEGLFIGKRTICYSELKCGGQAFRHLPDFITTDGDELTAVFEKAVEDYKDYTWIYADKISDLDPFRDGQALKRIHEQLSRN